jgi:hypothetical protein
MFRCGRPDVSIFFLPSSGRFPIRILLVGAGRWLEEKGALEARQQSSQSLKYRFDTEARDCSSAVGGMQEELSRYNVFERRKSQCAELVFASVPLPLENKQTNTLLL